MQVVSVHIRMNHIIVATAYGMRPGNPWLSFHGDYYNKHHITNKHEKCNNPADNGVSPAAADNACYSPARSAPEDDTGR